MYPSSPLFCLNYEAGFTTFSFFDRDHMQWSDEEEAAARKKVEENSAVRVLLEEQGR